jgi:hypothetical protein
MLLQREAKTMTEFRIGQRVHTTIDGPPAFPGGAQAPAGALGVVVGLPDGPGGDYFVQLACDPSGVADAYPPAGLAAVL